MFEKLVLKNFQCHEKLVLEFDPRVTVLCGPSDSGKSAVLRALRWACLNRPQGDDFIGDWGSAEYAEIRLRCDGTWIGRRRGVGGDNHYRTAGKVLRSFGTGVPSLVEGLLNVGEGNFQAQISPPLWFTESPAEVARQLNAIVNLSAIDRAMEHLAATVRRGKSDVSVSEARLKDAQDKAASLSWVGELDTQLVKIERLSTRIDRLDAECVGLRCSVESVLVGQSVAEDRDRALQHAKTALDAQIQWIEHNREQSELTGIIASLERLEKLSRTVIPHLSSVQEIQERCTELEGQISSIQTILSAIRNLRYAATTAELEVESCQDQIKRLTRGRCPICGQRMRT